VMPVSQPGLSAAEVAERVARGETNAYKARVGRTYWDILRDNLFNIFNLILFPLLGVIIAFGEYAVAFFAGFSVVTNALLGTIQEIDAKRRLDRLVALAASKVRVIRDGKEQLIATADVVLDDILPLEPGDRLPVDGVVLASDALEMDESHLTGESDAILKDPGDKVFSGAFCVAGTGVIRATQVGADNTINRLSSTARAYRNRLTPTQRRVMIIVDIAIILMLLLAPMLWLSDSLAGLVLLEKVKNVVVFITSLVPYGLVLIVIISLSIGAISITRHQTLIRRVNAVESLANATVLCFDKTGTLTQNKLAVNEILPLNGSLPDDIREQLYIYTHNLGHKNSTAAAVSAYVEDAAPAQSVTKVREIPFNSTRKWGAVVLQDETLILGAPERVLNGHNDIVARAEELSTQGLRVLTFARCTQPPQDGKIEAEPIALVTLSDQMRPDIRETLQAFRDQDVALKVISGDNIQTVRSIARQAGIEITHMYTGTELEAMNDEEFELAAAQGNVFARIEPETKRRIVSMLRQRGEHVAMVGDGVNDVPALKAADLAIVMNDGAQITKEIGDIILLNNAMSTLPRAFAEGREITQTIFGTVKLFLTKTFYNIMLFVYIGFMSLPFPITPIQINWVTFGTVNVVATLIAFKIMRPAPMERFRRDVLDYVLTGAFIGSAIMALLFAVVFFATGLNTAAARSALAIFATFFGILIFWNTFGIDLSQPRTLRQHWVVTLMGIFFTLIVITGMYAAPALFEFVRPTPLITALITSLLLLTIVVFSANMKHRYLISRLWVLTER
jgi:cation-transporting P-type ATPase E